eukprot:TRINITY_DN35452_c0_g1_i1.p1 TRINITY_DN35452_c0_g1~~TRINITY_DN35452_c0_g1_i1.p1  ORF type:complete len:289 (+),score=85.53 TRINITY_DN35452_c0_g1_i1:94-960(+)
MDQQNMLAGGAPPMPYPGMGSSPGLPSPYPVGQQPPPGAQPSPVPPGGVSAASMQQSYQQAALAQQMQYQHLQQQHQQQLQVFWQQQMQEVEQASDFKNHQLPLARIKKIMKADEDVRMISAEAPVVFSKACEMFILELTLRSWIHTEENKRRTLQKNDIAGAITRTDIFDFLVDIVPRDELKEDGMGLPRAQVAMPGADMSAYSSMYYMQPGAAAPTPMGQPGMMPPQMMVGRPAMAMDPSLYAQQPRPPLQYMQQSPMQQTQQPGQQMWAGQQQLPSTPGPLPQQQ